LPEALGVETPIYPAWQAAKATGDVSVLSAEDVKAFSEVEQALNHTLVDLERTIADFHKIETFIWNQSGIGSSHFDLQKLSEPRKREYLALLIQIYQSVADLQNEERQLRGAGLAIESGERDLTRINEAERRAMSTP
jgi:hypothetical protein